MSFYKMRPRSGTATQWATANPILAEREIGYEVPDDGIGTGVVKMKMGDGVTAWSDLPYAINKESDRKFIFIGDSYGEGYTPDGTVTPWISRVISNLGLSAVSASEGGSGFINEGKNGNTFLEILQSVSVSPKKEITDIIVGGGYNDRGYSQSELDTAILAFKTWCGTNYPNAKVSVAYIGGTNKPDGVYLMARTRSRYANACRKCGLSFLSGCELALHDYFTMFSSDGFHPNQSGQDNIAYYVGQCILTGHCSPYYEYKNTTVTASGNATSISGTESLGATINNGILQFSTQGRINISLGGVNYGQANGKISMQIATITGGLIIGSSYGTNAIPIPMIVQNNGSWYDVGGFLNVCNGKIYVGFLAINDSGTNYRDLTSITTIQIPLFSQSYDASMV